MALRVVAAFVYRANTLADTHTPEPQLQMIRSASLGNGSFVCTLGRHVDVCPVYCTEFNLAAAMSCMRATASVLSADDAASLLTPPMVSCALAVPTQVQETAAWGREVKGSGAAEQKLLKVVADPKSAPAPAALKKAFDAYMAAIQEV